MAQVFLYPAPSESPLDEDGNPFPSTGLRVTMNAYYDGQCRQGLLVRQDPNAFSAVAQPAVYAPVQLGYVTTQLASIPGQRDGQSITTVGRSAAGDGGGAQFSFALGVSSNSNAYTRINTSNGQWQMSADRGTGKVWLNIRWFGGIPEVWGSGEPTGPSYVDTKDAYDAAYDWATDGVDAADDLIVEMYFPGSAYAYELYSSIEPPSGNHRYVKFSGDGWSTSSPAQYGNPYWLAKNVNASGTFNPVGVGSCIRGAPNVHVILMENDGSTPGAGYRRFEATNIAFVSSGDGCGVCQRPTAVGDLGCGQVVMDGVYFGGCKVGFQCCNAEASRQYRIVARGCDRGIALGYFDPTYTMGAACWAQLFYGIDIQYCNHNIWWRAALSTHFSGGLNQAPYTTFYLFDTNNAPAQGACSVEGVHHEGPSGLLFDSDPANSSCAITFSSCHWATANDVLGRELYGAGWRFENCNGIGGYEWRGGSNSVIVFEGVGMRPSAINGIGGGAFSGQFYVIDPSSQNPRSLTTSGSFALDGGNPLHGSNLSITTSGDLTFSRPVNWGNGDVLRPEVILGGEHIVRFDLAAFNPTASLNDDAGTFSGIRGTFEFVDRGAKWQVSAFSGWGWAVNMATGIVAGANTQGSTNLAAKNNVVATVASANDAVTMPPASPGARVVVINNGANSMNLYPASGDNLGAGVNTAVAVPAGTNVDYLAIDRTNWEAMP